MGVFRRIPRLMGVLLLVDFVDELAAGMPTVGIPGIEAGFALTHTTAAFLVFTLPLLVAFVLEPPLFWLADRSRKQRFVVGGFVAMAACDLVVGLSGAFALVAGALALSATASGCGVSLSQAALMDAYPDDRERVMTRWTLMGALGDLAAPALFWVLATFALGWRAAFVASGLFIAAYACVLARTDFAAATQGGSAPDDAPGFVDALRGALGNGRLMVWLVGKWLCSLLDELLVAFGALWLRDHLGADAATRSAILMCFMAGSAVGLLLLERLLSRVEPIALLKACAFGAAASYAGWLATGSAASSAACMFLVGLFAGALYPIAKAQAYRALPGRSGTVNAVGHVFTPLDVAVPLVLGAIADRFGLSWALAVLLLQPIGLLVIAFSPVAKAPAQTSRIG